MAYLQIDNVSIKGISACVPSKVEENKLAYNQGGGGNYQSFFNTTGIARRRIAPDDVCASDLCYAAAEKLIEDLKWPKDSVDALVFVTQTPDYMSIPATSIILQNRLGLCSDCLAFDIALGCSGWVYSLSVLSSMMQGGTIKRALLLSGETATKFCSPYDKSSYPLFGDAGAVTALEYDSLTGSKLLFDLKSDGSGYEAIIIEDGGYRHKFCKESLSMESFGEGIERRKVDLALDGMSVFSFGISKAPKVVNSLIEHFNLSKDEIDFFTFHQANMFLNEKIRKKLSLPADKVLYSLNDFGNTSSASIPLTLLIQKREPLQNEHLRHIGCGFGVGLSWGAVYFETDSIVVPELIEV